MFVSKTGSHLHGLIKEKDFFLRGLIEGTVTAKVLSSRKQRESQDRRKPDILKTNIIHSG
jgi:hypothetical protein